MKKGVLTWKFSGGSSGQISVSLNDLQKLPRLFYVAERLGYFNVQTIFAWAGNQSLASIKYSQWHKDIWTSAHEKSNPTSQERSYLLWSSSFTRNGKVLLKRAIWPLVFCFPFSKWSFWGRKLDGSKVPFMTLTGTLTWSVMKSFDCFILQNPRKRHTNGSHYCEFM